MERYTVANLSLVAHDVVGEWVGGLGIYKMPTYVRRHVAIYAGITFRHYCVLLMPQEAETDPSCVRAKTC
jgi:hypothetical protein